jgi:hypothetical protein
MLPYKLTATYKNRTLFKGSFYDADGLEMAKSLAKLLTSSNDFSDIELIQQEDKKIVFLNKDYIK